MLKKPDMCIHTINQSEIVICSYLLLLKHTTLHHNLPHKEIKTHATFKCTSRIFFAEFSSIQEIIYLKSSTHILMLAVPAVSPSTTKKSLYSCISRKHL